MRNFLLLCLVCHFCSARLLLMSDDDVFSCFWSPPTFWTLIFPSPRGRMKGQPSPTIHSNDMVMHTVLTLEFRLIFCRCFRATYQDQKKRRWANRFGSPIHSLPMALAPAIPFSPTRSRNILLYPQSIQIPGQQGSSFRCGEEV